MTAANGSRRLGHHRFRNLPRAKPELARPAELTATGLYLSLAGGCEVPVRAVCQSGRMQGNVSLEEEVAGAAHRRAAALVAADEVTLRLLMHPDRNGPASAAKYLVMRTTSPVMSAGTCGGTHNGWSASRWWSPGTRRC